MFISMLFPVLLQISDGLTLTHYGMYLNFSILGLFALNILIVATDTCRLLLDRALRFYEKKKIERRKKNLG